MNVEFIIFLGHDTTASALAWSIYALGQHPDLQSRVYEDVIDVMGLKSTVDVYVCKHV